MKSSNVRTMEWAGEIGLRIREAREAKGLSQADVGDLLLVHRNTVENWENGGTQPLKQLVGLADALDVNFRWLLYGREEEDLQHWMESVDSRLSAMEQKQDVILEAIALGPLEEGKPQRSRKRASGSGSNGVEHRGTGPS